MTSIAFDGSTLAADSLITDGSMRAGYMNKIIKLLNGGYVTGCGSAHGAQLVADWMNGLREAPSDKQMEDITVLHIDINGKGWFYDGTVSAAIPAGKKDAAGSGAPYAKVAMEMGASAEQAVRQAMKFDVFSGGKINVVQIQKLPKQKKVKQIKAQEPVEVMSTVIE